jgi:hypothetical protein
MKVTTLLNCKRRSSSYNKTPNEIKSRENFNSFKKDLNLSVHLTFIILYTVLLFIIEFLHVGS